MRAPSLPLIDDVGIKTAIFIFFIRYANRHPTRQQCDQKSLVTTGRGRTQPKSGRRSLWVLSSPSHLSACTHDDSLVPPLPVEWDIDERERGRGRDGRRRMSESD